MRCISRHILAYGGDERLINLIASLWYNAFHVTSPAPGFIEFQAIFYYTRICTNNVFDV
ncbi:UNVERIFIED_CONTAM: hypothetical protein FKN15_015757 [Acipenser sinensis]